MPGAVSERNIVLCPRPDGFVFKTGIGCPRSDTSNCFLLCPESRELDGPADPDGNIKFNKFLFGFADGVCGIEDVWGSFAVTLCFQARDGCIVEDNYKRKKTEQISRRSNSKLSFPEIPNSQKLNCLNSPFKMFKLSI